MQRAHILAAVAVVALVSSASAQQAPSPPPVQPGAAGRAFANLNATVSTMDGFGATGDALQFTMFACFQSTTGFCTPSSQAANIVNFPAPQSGTLSTTLTGSPGGGTLTAASGFCRSEMAGSPIYIPGAGLNGAGFLTRITECVGGQPSTRFAVDPPVAQVPSAAVTVAWGAMALNQGQGWQASDIGKGIFVGLSGNGAGLGAVYTIAAVPSTTSIQLSANVNSIIPNAAISFVWGHDDSAAVTNACRYVLESGLHDLQVPAQHYVPSLGYECWGVKRHGNGGLLAANYGMPPATTSVSGTVKELVIPDNAPPPAPPVRSVVAARDLPQTRACGPNPVIAQIGDSLETLLPNQLSGLGTYPGAFQLAFLKQNRAIWPAWRNGGIGGQQMANIDGNPLASNTDLITTTSASTLTQVAAATPCLVTLGDGNNDGVGLSLPALVDSYLKLTQPAAGVFATTPDLIYVTHHPYSNVNSGVVGTSPSTEQNEFASGFIASFAHVMGKSVIDGAREGIKHREGYDPGALQFVRRYDLNYNTNNIGFPIKPGVWGLGLSIQFKKNGQNGSAFWSNFTGNGGATDPRGPFIGFQIGTNSDNLLWLFYNTSTNQIGYEVDPSAGLPGLGADGPTGLPPVTPSLLANMTVQNTGPSGVAQVSASGNVFGACSVGGTVAVPGAGPTVTPSSMASYTAPLVATVQTCNSASLMTLNAAAQTTWSTAKSMQVMFGNPVTWSSVTDTSNCANEPFGVEFAVDMARIWFCDQFHPVYAGYIMRGRNSFQPQMFSGGNFPSLTVAADSNGGTTYQIAEPIRNQVTFTDDQINGPAGGPPLNNTSYSGPCGGDGNNHNCEGFGARVIQPLMDAQDLALGLSQGLYTTTPATGFSLTVPIGYGTVLLTPAATLGSGTITLPQSYPQNQDLVITSTQTITALTLGANSGQSINGAPTTLAANTSVKFRLEGATWYRLQ